MIETILILNKLGTCIYYKNFSDMDFSSIQHLSNSVFSAVSNTKDSNIVYDFSYQHNNKQFISSVFFRYEEGVYIVFICDELENELATIDLINIIYEIAKEIFKGINEDVIVHNLEKVHVLIDEIITGGVVIEVNKKIIIQSYKEIMEDK